ncbi:hypothetical protein [Neopusillimonas aromaticivorans]|uniref:hypothetical protein n=1 Tax=Neopusillimonas aromaticivorans TaxID=2979868 RepID=UPI00259591B1|nr:hypothetical protein [Neopusillimonas aromaticivorans]WJJ93435.1 hypothetical protein N7E01_15965 [Neopusillimonas aromaticivorans]
MPVRPPTRLLAVVAQQNQALRSKMHCQSDGTRSGVAILRLEIYAPHSVAVGLLRHQLACEYLPGFLPVHPPPVLVHGEQHIGPWRSPECRVGDDYCSILSPVSPLPDLFAVRLRETGAAGDADELSPAAREGSGDDADPP